MAMERERQQSDRLARLLREPWGPFKNHVARVSCVLEFVSQRDSQCTVVFVGNHRHWQSQEWRSLRV